MYYMTASTGKKRKVKLLPVNYVDFVAPYLSGLYIVMSPLSVDFAVGVINYCILMRA